MDELKLTADQGYRSKKVQSLFGPVTDERVYYHCSACGRGWFPTDEEMGLTDRETPAARQVITLVRMLEPFAEAADRVLSRLTGINVWPRRCSVRRKRWGRMWPIVAREAK